MIIRGEGNINRHQHSLLLLLYCFYVFNLHDRCVVFVGLLSLGELSVSVP